MNKTIRIGMVDYRPDVGHANGFSYKLSERAQHAAEYRADIVAYTALEESLGRSWAEERGVPYFQTPEEMAGHVDAIVIPASSNPERHLDLLESCLGLHVPVFIDKPLANNLASAKEIVAAAKRARVPVMSSSILRFANEIQELRNQCSSPNFIQTWGSDNERYDEFVIHPVEMALSLTPQSPVAVSRKAIGTCYRMRIIFDGGQEAEVFFNAGSQPYEASICTDNGWHHKTLLTDFWVPFLDVLLEGLANRREIVSAEQTLKVIATLEAARISANDQTVNIDQL